MIAIRAGPGNSLVDDRRLERAPLAFTPDSSSERA
jgi:hypothetical protein